MLTDLGFPLRFPSPRCLEVVFLGQRVRSFQRCCSLLGRLDAQSSGIEPLSCVRQILSRCFLISCVFQRPRFVHARAHLGQVFLEPALLSADPVRRACWFSSTLAAVASQGVAVSPILHFVSTTVLNLHLHGQQR